jgi:predicted metal-dependent phosphoesterase TrpH
VIKVDLHIHTACSADSLTLFPEVVQWATRRGLGAIAITDHNTIRGALAVRRISRIPVIVGEEIRTQQGEVTGLFLEEEIPPHLTVEETLRRIRAQGGLVYVPHPLDRVRGSSLAYPALMDLLEGVDALEVFNARVTFPVDNRLAEALAARSGLLGSAGSDAHQAFEIGRAYVEMPAFGDASSFLAALRHGRPRGSVSSPFVHLGSTYARVTKGLHGQARLLY